MTQRAITIREGDDGPIFDGEWTIGEVLQVADQLRLWVLSSPADGSVSVVGEGVVVRPPPHPTGVNHDVH